MKRLVLCVCLLSLFVSNAVFAHSSGVQVFPLPDVKPFDPIFRGNQLWFSPDQSELMYLINGKITTVQLPSVFGGGGLLLTSAPDGGLWGSAGYGPRQFLHLTAKNQMSVYSIEDKGASSSAGGADGSLWYTGDGSSISRLSLKGAITHFQIYPSLPPPSYNYPSAQIVRAADGGFWSSGDEITYSTMQGKHASFLLPSYSGLAQQLMPLPDGCVWILAVNPFLPNSPAHIVIMNKKGETQSFTFDQPINVMDPNNIGYEFGYTKNYVTVLAPDGTLWFLDYRHRQIVHATIYGHIIKLYSFPGLIGSLTGWPAMLTMGPDGALWITETDAHQIVRITLP